MTRRCLQVLQDYWELVAVGAAAALGLTVQSPLVQVVRHQGIDVLLAVLVFSTAISIDPRCLRRLPASWRQLTLALAVGSSILPAASWLVSLVVPSASLRHGIATIGLAPCEVASIATTSMAGGDVALAGGMLIGSTILSVSVAGPILALETSGTSVHPGHIVFNLLVVVATPLLIGIFIRSLKDLPSRGEAVASATSTITVAALVALVASEVHLSTRYVSAFLAIALLVIVSAVVGRLIGLGGSRPAMKALLLTTSMRDFAIAAALATAAFGPTAAAPLGIYGITVLLWGTGSAGFMRRLQT